MLIFFLLRLKTNYVYFGEVLNMLKSYNSNYFFISGKISLFLLSCIFSCVYTDT